MIPAATTVFTCTPRRFRVPRALSAPAARLGGDRGRARGFTLIEVLIVVAIIALLIAILLPTLQQSRIQTRRVTCQSNLRQIMTAWHMFLDGNNGRFPRGLYTNITYGGIQGVPEQFQGPRPLNRYLGPGLPAITRDAEGAAAFSCPGDTAQHIQLGAEGGVQSRYFNYYGTSYRTNRYMIGPKPPLASGADPCFDVVEEALIRLDNQVGVTLSEISNESRLVVIGDFGWDDWAFNLLPDSRLEWHGRKGNYVHSSWQNIGFMDGHADFIDIRRGLHVRSTYTVIPFRSLQQKFVDCQVEGNF